MQPDNARPAAKGWCPGAHRPMESGDGWIIRVRPRLARLEAFQWGGLAELALAYGNGIIDLTSRANLQIRGIKQAAIDPVLQELERLGLLDADAETEARRNVLCAPDWCPGDATERLTLEFLDRLGALPALPAKFGFAVDVGRQRRLADASADIRIERGASGGLILRADARAFGVPVTEQGAVTAAIAMAQAFVAAGGVGRMAHLAASFEGTEAPAEKQAPMRPGTAPLGVVVGAAFGQIAAADMLALPLVPIRVTPWRLLILEGAGLPQATPFITAPDDPLLRIDACPGAPMCASATVATRALARRLTPAPGQSLHVSGCAKGCARPRDADVTLVGRDGRFDVVRQGAAWDMPERTGLLPEEVSLHALQL